MQHGVKDEQAEIVEELIRNNLAGWAPVPDVRIPAIIGPLGEKILVERKTGCIILSDTGDPITSGDPYIFKKANNIDMGKFRNHVGFFEGVVQYMYLDVKFNVTVGIGHLIEDVAKAEELPFHRRRSRANPHEIDIKSEFDEVRRKRALAKDGASAFKDITHLDLNFTDIEALFDADVAKFLELLRDNRYFPDFETYPAGVQLGMLDVAYTMGVDGFFEGFPVFRQALEFRNWIEVAEQSHRKEEIDGKKNEKMAARNVIVRDWFLDAIEDEPFFINTGRAYKSLSMIAG